LIRTALTALSCITTLVACSAESSAPQSANNSFNLDEATIRTIASEFAIQKGMYLLCDGPETDQLSQFMEDLRYAEAPRELRDSITTDSVEMLNKISAEEPEYICTPEMFEGAEQRVTEAQLQWDKMRGITP